MPKSLSVQAVPACPPVSMWTVFVSVVTSLCCDLNGGKMNEKMYFPPCFQFSLELAVLSSNTRALNFIEETRKQKMQKNSEIH